MQSDSPRKNRSFFWIFIVVMGLAFCGFVGIVALMAVFSPDHRVSFLQKPIDIVKIEGGIFESEDILKDLQEDIEDDSVKAVLLRINSPGGAVAPSQEIFRQVLKVRAAGKKVVASMGTLAASGGYYIASAADKIIANPGTITGSIGVIMENFGVEELAKTLKVEPRTIKSGKMKDAGSPFRSMTDEDRAFLQNLSDDMYDQFTRDVAEQREIPIEKIREIAEGKIYSGRQAKEIGLVDEIGNFYDAIELTRKVAGLPKDAGASWPHEPSAFEKFFGGESAEGALRDLFFKLGAKPLPAWFMRESLPETVF
jgi:protease-4